MAIKKQKNAPKVSARNSKGKNFDAALAAFALLAQERVRNARDPFATGIKIAEQIRMIAEQLEYEVRAESVALTEAGYISGDAVGVGIGVF
jgi:hypothetical protein